MFRRNNIEHEMNLYIGERIKWYREFENMSQQKLANMIGMKSATNIVMMEKNGKSISITKLFLIADVLGIYIQDLLPANDIAMKLLKDKS